MRLIRVLIVEDSPVARDFLTHILSSDPQIRVIGTAGDGEEAVETVANIRPDVITMDIQMPKLNGLDATRRIMETHPTPIVIVSAGSDTKEAATGFRAMEAGALAIIQKPAGIGHPDHENGAADLIRTVKLMSEVKVVKRWTRHKGKAARPVTQVISKAKNWKRTADIKIVAIGASTGGPLVLQTILSGLPRSFSAPVLIVQHMSPGFIRPFVEWLARLSNLPVHVAGADEVTLSGHAYFAPDGFQMRVSIGGRILLTEEPLENGLCPSVSCLFRSVANVYGANALGVLLTGMGKDGAEELKLMREKGAITIAQDRESCVVHGMPGEAIHLGAASYVLSPAGIASALASFTEQGRTSQNADSRQ